MAFRVRPDGTIECDLPEEALALARGMAAKTEAAPAQERPINGAAIEASAADLSALIAEMSDSQRNFLRTLKDKREAEIKDIVASMPGTPTTSELSGTILGLTKALKRANIVRDRVFTNVVKGSSAKRKSTYTAGPLLLAANF